MDENTHKTESPQDRILRIAKGIAGEVTVEVERDATMRSFVILGYIPRKNVGDEKGYTQLELSCEFIDDSCDEDLALQVRRVCDRVRRINREADERGRVRWDGH